MSEKPRDGRHVFPHAHILWESDVVIRIESSSYQFVPARTVQGLIEKHSDAAVRIVRHMQFPVPALSVIVFKIIADGDVGILCYCGRVKCFQHIRFCPVIRIDMDRVLTHGMVNTALPGG